MKHAIHFITQTITVTPCSHHSRVAVCFILCMCRLNPWVLSDTLSCKLEVIPAKVVPRFFLSCLYDRRCTSCSPLSRMDECFLQQEQDQVSANVRFAFLVEVRRLCVAGQCAAFASCLILCWQYRGVLSLNVLVKQIDSTTTACIFKACLFI